MKKCKNCSKKFKVTKEKQKICLDCSYLVERLVDGVYGKTMRKFGTTKQLEREVQRMVNKILSGDKSINVTDIVKYISEQRKG
tara:strand:- start:349 stop:597 length:249 start_codon:yes stop_codon:yes gene_type:complete